MKVILLIISALLILLYMLQDGKTEGFLNSNQVYKNIKERGPEKAVFALTGVLGVLFIVLAFLEEVL